MFGCSSLTLQSKDQKHFFARTMDFTKTLGNDIVFVPRDYTIVATEKNPQPTQTTYAMLGMGNTETPMPALFDGLNEVGLMGAVLYYRDHARYFDEVEEGKTAINPLFTITNILASCKTVDDVVQFFESHTLINEMVSVIDFIPPLHFTFSDRTGESIIIEPNLHGITVHRKTVGVMTNSPNYEWQEKNLWNYVGISPYDVKGIVMNGVELKPLSLGTGGLGLPGDFTPPSRFVRVAMVRQYIEEAQNEDEAIRNIFHILSLVNVPKGMVINDEGLVDYTCYTAAMCSESLTYYCHTYEDRQIAVIKLENENYDATTLKTYPISTKQSYNMINE